MFRDPVMRKKQEIPFFFFACGTDRHAENKSQSARVYIADENCGFQPLASSVPILRPFRPVAPEKTGCFSSALLICFFQRTETVK